MSVKASVNLLLLSLAFGGGVVHSFIVSPIAFKHLPRESFSELQNKVFPLYFAGQTLLPLGLAVTTPVAIHCAGPLLGVSALGGALNLLWVLPVCRDIKEQRKKLIAEKKHEQIVDGEVRPSDAMALLNKQFGMYHGISSLLNMASILSLGVYGYVLAKRIRF